VPVHLLKVRPGTGWPLTGTGVLGRCPERGCEPVRAPIGLVRRATASRGGDVSGRWVGVIAVEATPRIASLADDLAT